MAEADQQPAQLDWEVRVPRCTHREQRSQVKAGRRGKAREGKRREAAANSSWHCKMCNEE